jgi:carbon-monoxide dehydrogenase medium subunit
MVAVTGVGEAPYRAKAVEAALVGNEGTSEAIVAAASHATDGVRVNSDIHADAEYRTAMAGVYTRRAIQAALDRLGE